jgi:hypothetical protein
MAAFLEFFSLPQGQESFFPDFILIILDSGLVPMLFTYRSGTQQV